jgi:SAM-dependent methyltransferase
VDEILRSLRQGTVVLDLGSGPGSLETTGYGVFHIKVDLELQHVPTGRFVQADASNLPFKASVFDAILCNHSLEHFPDLFRSLGEIGRVLKSNGVLYISVPFSESVTDRLYRWLSEGGGHVNQFKSAEEVERIVVRSTGLSLTAMRPLCTSLSFLNPANSPKTAAAKTPVSPQRLRAVSPPAHIRSPNAGPSVRYEEVHSTVGLSTSAHLRTRLTHRFGQMSACDAVPAIPSSLSAVQALSKRGGCYLQSIGAQDVTLVTSSLPTISCFTEAARSFHFARPFARNYRRDSCPLRPIACLQRRGFRRRRPNFKNSVLMPIARICA